MRWWLVMVCVGCSVESAEMLDAAPPPDVLTTEPDVPVLVPDALVLPDAAPTADAASLPDAAHPDAAAPEPIERCAQIAPAPLTRLTARQYHATVQSLFPDAPTPSLIDDDGPFVPQLAAEKYAAAAAEIAAAAALPAQDVPTFVADLGARAFRRPLDAAEQAWLERVAAAAPQDLDQVGRLRLVLEVMLQAPQFLYRVERTDAVEGWGLLDGDSLAARLAYALTDGPPDGALLADVGALHDPAVLARQAARLASTPAGQAKRMRFLVEWLELDAFDDVIKVDPAFTPTLQAAIRAEAEAFLAHALAQGSLVTLLTDRTAVLDEATAALYGVDPGQALPEAERAGILTRAAFLALQAGPQVKSPIHRGAFIREKLFCAPLPPPPPTVNDAPIVRGSLEDDGAPVTLRELTERRTAGPDCQGCHNLINPLGFTLQHYDALGRFVREERGADYVVPVDARGAAPGTDVVGEIADGVALSHALAGSAQVSDCFADQWFEFVFERALHPADACSLERLRGAFRDSGGDLDALLLETVQLDAFRGLRAP